MKVREVIKLIGGDGWFHGATDEAVTSFPTHPKPVTTTVVGNLGDDVKPGTLASILRQAGLRGAR